MPPCKLTYRYRYRVREAAYRALVRLADALRERGNYQALNAVVAGLTRGCIAPYVNAALKRSAAGEDLVTTVSDEELAAREAENWEKNLQASIAADADALFAKIGEQDVTQ